MTQMFDRREIRTLSDIQHNSRLLIQGLAAKGGSGLRNFLTQLYPDQAHFLYELLQNAEDAGAKNVRFDLKFDRLVFAHDGPRLFTLSDIDSITNVADSTKRDDHTRIGKFGVGFKAVYDFTNTPEIHSGDFRFKIIDLFYPEDRILPFDRRDTDGLHTVFVLPFDRIEKPPEEAFHQISAGLSALSSTTLLFLRNIRRLTYSISDDLDGSIERVAHEDRVHTLRTTRGSAVEENRWLRVERAVDVIDEEGEVTSATVAAAFQLTSVMSEVPKPARGAVSKPARGKLRFAPAELGDVCIFFPTAKESSGLRFHIHAPFESTVARDSIRDTSVNEQLVQAIGALVADTAVDLAVGGDLTNSFLDVLPLESDLMGKSFWPIRDSVIASFKTNAITPCRTGSFAPASELIFGTKSVVAVLTDSDMRFLVNQGTLGWESCDLDETPVFVKLPGEKSLRARAFVSQLFSEQVDADAVLGLVASLGDEIDDAVDPRRTSNLDSWLSRFDDKRLRNFYKVLSESDEFFMHDFSEIALVRVVDDGDGYRHVTPPAALLPDREETGSRMQVSPAIWSLGDNLDSDAPSIRSFLEEIGVRVWDAKAELSAELKALDDLPVPMEGTAEENEEFERLSRFVETLATNPALASTFIDSPFLIATGSSGERIRVSPREAYFCGEIEPTGWESVAPFLSASGHRQFPLWEGYAAITDVANFLHQVGASGRPRTVWVNIGHNKSFQHAWTAGRTSAYREHQDWTLEHASVLMKHGNSELFRAMWSWVLSLETKYLRAHYSHNRQAERHTMKSNLVQVLTINSWVEDRDGNLCKPQDVDRDSLHPDLPFSDAAVLEEIGFGLSNSLQRIQLGRRESEAQRLGFDNAEQAEAARRLTEGLTAEEISQMVEDRKFAGDAPEDATYGERRTRLTTKDVEIAPLRQQHVRERAVRVDETRLREERRAYLRATYERDGSMFCQGCQNKMPFQGPDRTDYFEAVQCVENSTEFRANVLSLCPVCSAKFRSWRVARSETWHDELLSFPLLEGELSASVSLQLAGVDSEMYFTGKHLKDIQILLGT